MSSHAFRMLFGLRWNCEGYAEQPVCVKRSSHRKRGRLCKFVPIVPSE